MKIQLLLQREPFGDICCRSLARYAQATGHGQVQLRWHDAPLWRRADRLAENQWLCNSDLNVIFAPAVNRSALRPIFNEFSSSVRPGRNRWQRQYVQSALNPGTARWFASARLTMHPSWADPHQQVFVPGNQKIRLFEPAEQRCTSIWKSDFSRENFARELDGRCAARLHGVCVPPLIDVDTDACWYREPFIITTPLNRLRSRPDQDRVAQCAWSQLETLLLATVESIPTEDYVDQLIQDVRRRSLDLRWLSTCERQEMVASAESLGRKLIAGPAKQRMATAMTHGDFQPANIVMDKDQVWIIDWECFGRRQVTYDAWVLATGARSSGNLTDRLAAAARSDWGASLPFPFLGNRIAAMADLPVGQQAGLFLLEETCARLEDDANPLFSRGAGRMRPFLPILQAWPRILP